jgi:POT family proton-dependent oligopeptide transporter
MSNTFFGHPRGLSTLFFTEFWERFSYYGMRAILILFMTTPAAQQGLGLDTETAGAAYGLYTAAVYLLALPGGWLADNVFGQKKTIWYGGILIMIGHAILAIPGSPGIFFAGLAFVASGTGMLKPNISSIVGSLYGEDKGARRDAGFSIFYMSINLGSFLGQIIVPIVADWDWHVGFGLAAIGMFFGLLWFRMSEKTTLAGIGEVPKPAEKVSGAVENHSNKGIFRIGLPLLLIVILAVLQLTGQIEMTSIKGIAEAMKIVIVLIVVFYFLTVIFGGDLTQKEIKKILVIGVLFMGAAVFWSGFEQAGSALNLYARDFTARTIFGWEMPAGVLQSVNPAFIIIFAPLIGALWVKLAAKNINPRTPVKFSIGLILLGLGFLVMVYAARIATTGAQTGMFFLVLCYFLHSIGELTLSPVGLSAMTKLAPAKLVGQMMGIWFVATALGNLIAGTFGGNFDPSNVQQMPDLFMTFVKLPVGAGLVMLALSPIFNKWMDDVV